MESQAKPKKKFEIPHSIAILFFIAILVAVLTWVIPAGSYTRVKDPNTGRNVVDPDSFTTEGLEASPIGPWKFLQLVPAAMADGQEIIFFILIVGGAFNIITVTGALEAGIGRIAKGLKGKAEFVLIPVIVTIFSIGGCTFGMAEETIIFIPIGVALARALGYDAIVGMAMVYLGAACGFDTGALNPFTCGVAQGIAELPIFSGAGVRFAVQAAMIVATSWLILRYGNKVRKDPSKSYVAELEIAEKDNQMDLDNLPDFNLRRKLVILTIVAGFGVIVWGVFAKGFYIAELAAIFFTMGLISGIISGMTINEMVKAFVAGASDICGGALMVGFARLILVCMSTASILDTVVHAMASAIQSLPSWLSLFGMYLAQLLINFFIPSGSGQAAATMPIMVPLSDILGIERQVAVLAYQFGDGFTNALYPTGASMLACCSIAKFGYDKWLKFFWPIMIAYFVIGLTALFLCHFFGYA